MAPEIIDICSAVIPSKSGYRMAVDKNLFWKRKDPNTTSRLEIRVWFLDGNKGVQEKIKEYAETWQQYANIQFVYVTGKPSDIRIHLGEVGVWNSEIGTSAADIESSTATMNLGFDPLPGVNVKQDAVDKYYDDMRRHVLHEFGHALGCVHEHSSPEARVIPWNKEKAYAYFKRTNGWDKDTVNFNVFKLYEKSQTQYSAFDRLSIMVYGVPKEIMTDEKYSIPHNTELSAMDKEYIGKIYPFSDEQPTYSSGSLASASRQPSSVRSRDAVHKLRSANGRFLFVMQDDGNVVLYEGQHPKWASNTHGQSGGPFLLIMQEDGNLVAYNMASGHPFWATNTYRQPTTGPFTLIMQDDGNCVIYNGANQPTWATNTCER